MDHHRLGPFDVLTSQGPLGRGGMGAIWPAVHRTTDTPVAVKVMAQTGDALTTALTREIRTAASLDHPGIIQLFDCGVAEQPGPWPAGSPWVAMEHAVGGDLGAWQPHLSWDGVRASLLAVLDALAHAHARGVLHRDVKPGNVLVRRAHLVTVQPDLADLVLADFGLAEAVERRSDPAETDRLARGTRAYMAPEQREGRWRDQGPWTDLYSLGCLGWELVTGAPPSGPAAPLAAAIAVPDGLQAWLDRLRAPSIRGRFRCAADAAYALVQLPAPSGSETMSTPRHPPLPTMTATAAALPASERTDDDAWRVGGGAPPPPEDWRPPRLGWRVGAPLVASVGRGLHNVRTVPLVGRDAERDTLWMALRRVHGTGRPAVVVVRGAPGVGRSRVAAWLAHRAHETGAATHWSASAGPAEPSGSALARMVSEGVRLGGLDRDAARRRLADHGLGLDDERIDALTAWLHPMDGAQTLGARLSATADWVAAGCWERPAVVVLDDVHRDEASVRFARELLDRDAPILIVATSAVTDSEDVDVLASLPERSDVALGPLDPESTRSLLHEVLGLRSDLARQVTATVAGNPQFAVEWVREGVRSGSLELDGLGLFASGRVELPADLASLWSGVVDALAEDIGDRDMEALELAAALGGGRIDAWASALGRDPARLLTDLQRRGLARLTDDGFAFDTPMLAQALDARARRAGRAAMWHERCAEVHAGDPARVGRHLLEAGRRGEAARPLYEAGMAAHDRGELHEAEWFLERAIEGLPAGAERVQALASVAHARLLQGRSSAALALFDRAFLEAEQRGDPVLVARVQLKHARAVQQQGDLDRAEAMAETSLATLRTRGAHPQLVAALTLRAGQHYDRGRVDEAHPLWDEALAMAVACHDEQGHAEVLQRRGTLIIYSGRIKEGEALLRQARDIRQRVGNPIDVASIDLRLAEALRKQEDYAPAVVLARSAMERFRRLGVRTMVAESFNMLGILAQRMGDLDEAERAFRKSDQAYRGTNHGDAHVPGINLHLMNLGRKRFEGLAEQLDQDRTILVETSPMLVPYIDLALLVCHGHAGDETAFQTTWEAMREPVWEGWLTDNDVPRELLEIARYWDAHQRQDLAAQCRDEAARHQERLDQ